MQRQPSTAKGTRGEWRDPDNLFLCFTIERPWLDNKQQLSSIPPGRYLVKKRVSPKYGHHWHLQDVPGRSLILIHDANIMTELRGCIAVGGKMGVLNGYPAVLNSDATMARLRKTLPDEFYLEVRA